jgi:hypothetical protein
VLEAAAVLVLDAAAVLELEAAASVPDEAADVLPALEAALVADVLEALPPQAAREAVINALSPSATADFTLFINVFLPLKNINLQFLYYRNYSVSFPAALRQNDEEFDQAFNIIPLIDGNGNLISWFYDKLCQFHLPVTLFFWPLFCCSSLRFHGHWKSE